MLGNMRGELRTLNWTKTADSILLRVVPSAQYLAAPLASPGCQLFH